MFSNIHLILVNFETPPRLNHDRYRTMRRSAPDFLDFPGPNWRAIIDALPLAVLALDAEGIVIHANERLISLFPRARVGLHIAQLNRSPELLTAIDEAQMTDQPVTVQVIDRVPLQRRLSAVITRLAYEVEPVRGVQLLISFRDETEQEKLAQMRADFVAHASHELRTPLASLKGFIETIQGAARSDPKAQERFLSLMNVQATRMSQLINDLLVLSRAETHAHMLPTEIVDLNEVLAFVAQSLEPLAASRGTEIEFKGYQGAAQVTGDREDLVQVFQNLVQNAIRYGKEQGYIEISIDDAPSSAIHGRRFAIAVRDDGPGIAAHHIPRLTERFYRISPSASREVGGTGLGLAIVKHIVSRHRGELEITSQLGEGAAFKVLLNQNL